MNRWQILIGDCRNELKKLEAESVQTCITSPPYFGLRDYGHEGQIGLEDHPELFINELVSVFREVRRVLKNDGTVWLNLGDSYATRGNGSHQPAETLAGGVHGKTLDGEKVNRGRAEGYNPTRNAHAIGLKHKDLVGIPWRVALALQADGWYLRSDIIWHKPNPMPESVKDRPTKSHEYIFLLSKEERYFYDSEAVKEDAKDWSGTASDSYKIDTTEEKYGANNGGNSGLSNWAKENRTGIKFGGKKYGDSDDPKHATKSGKEYVFTGKRNKRSVWTVTTKPFRGAHFATFPIDLIEPCILAGSAENDVVLDPFAGSGTTCIAALRHNRSFIGCELNSEYAEIAQNRIIDDAPLMNANTQIHD